MTIEDAIVNTKLRKRLKRMRKNYVRNYITAMSDKGVGEELVAKRAIMVDKTLSNGIIIGVKSVRKEYIRMVNEMMCQRLINADVADKLYKIIDTVVK